MAHWEIHWKKNGKWESAWWHVNESGVTVPTEFEFKELAELSLECFFVEQDVSVEYGMLAPSECHTRDEFIVVEKN